MSQQQLAYEITKLSVSPTWETAKEEWKLYTIYESDSWDSCTCGHPIKEICILTNKINNAKVQVGNCCVKKFLGLPSDLIFQALKRVKKEIEKSLNIEALSYAKEKNWLNDWEYTFYINIMGKRILTAKQKAKKLQVNNLILQRMKPPAKGVTA